MPVLKALCRMRHAVPGHTDSAGSHPGARFLGLVMCLGVWEPEPGAGALHAVLTAGLFAGGCVNLSSEPQNQEQSHCTKPQENPRHIWYELRGRGVSRWAGRTQAWPSK